MILFRYIAPLPARRKRQSVERDEEKQTALMGAGPAVAVTAAAPLKRIFGKFLFKKQ